MKIYKSIFRVDFPLNYSLMDKLGDEFQFMKSITSVEPYNNIQGNVDLNSRSIILHGALGKDRFTVNQTLNSFDFIVEYNEAIDFTRLSNHPILEFTDKVIKRIGAACNDTFERIGYRSWIVIEDDKFKFASIKQQFENKNSIFCNYVNELFGVTSDLGIIIEASKADGTSIRILTGPYQQKEWIKYFSKDIKIVEGLIIDIDIYLAKVQMPNLDIKQFSRKVRNTCDKYVNGTYALLLEELNSES